MKLAICSDLHLEFGDLYLANEQNADLLILGGDIFVACELKDWLHDESAHIITTSASQKARADRYFNFVRQCLHEFNHVIFIMGNHEHYHGDYAETAKIISDTFGVFNNFHFLDKQHKIINDVLFYGGTLWTDMNGEDPLTLYQIAGMMNDYRGVKNSTKTVQYRVPDMTKDESNAWSYKERPAQFRPEDSVEDHKAFLKGLDAVLALHPNMPTVVVGHHAPSRASTHPRYKTEFVMNGAYSTSLDDFILDRRQIKLWTHGHTHEDFDYMIGTTRVVCNPRGYDGYEARADNFQLKYVEV